MPLNNVKSQKGIITGKLFEYLASQQPILAIGPKDGDAATILKTQEGTTVVDFNEPIDWKIIISICEHKPIRNESLQPYSRKELAKQYASLLQEVITSSYNQK